ncbi:hypothetical protein E2C01_066898 [Portunus trituberculatus]|uniref:Integrase catalytic domain-containing protein n=1 Tax=Portunus trituberculatus TaxID=210409 RepID=A0A5B7HRZ8_PORTR|nr:hypothetical protein [Portunus trituberculatus]
MESGITLRPDKFRFCRRSVNFAGYLLGWEGYQLSHDLISIITDLKMPDKPTLTDVRSWLGLVNQVAPFLAVATVMEPFRAFLKKPNGKVVYWDKQLEALVASAKDTIGLLRDYTSMMSHAQQQSSLTTAARVSPSSFYSSTVTATADDEVGRVVDLRQVEEEAERDEEYRLVRECVANKGWAERKDQEPLSLGQYFRMLHNLSCQGGMVLYILDEKHSQLVVPAALRRAVLVNLHPLLPTPSPQYTFQQVVTDLCQLDGNNYITLADRLTGWLEIEHLPGDTTCAWLIKVFRRWFRRFGIPEELSCDGSGRATTRNRRHLHPFRYEPAYVSDDGVRVFATLEPSLPNAREAPAPQTGTLSPV